MRVKDLIDELSDLLEQDPEATVDVVGYSTIRVSGKNLDEPIRIG